MAVFLVGSTHCSRRIRNRQDARRKLLAAGIFHKSQSRSYDLACFTSHRHITLSLPRSSSESEAYRHRDAYPIPRAASYRYSTLPVGGSGLSSQSSKGTGMFDYNRAQAAHANYSMQTIYLEDTSNSPLLLLPISLRLSHRLQVTSLLPPSRPIGLYKAPWAVRALPGPLEAFLGSRKPIIHRQDPSRSVHASSLSNDHPQGTSHVSLSMTTQRGSASQIFLHHSYSSAINLRLREAAQGAQAPATQPYPAATSSPTTCRPRAVITLSLYLPFRVSSSLLYFTSLHSAHSPPPQPPRLAI